MKRFILILFFATPLSLSALSQSSNAIKEYIDTYKELAINEEIRTGVPAAITLAQGILESEAGQSHLSSADGALTALTSSFCIDILGLKRRSDLNEQQKKKTRLTVHLIFAVIFFLCVMIFKWINNKSIIDVILKVAGFTYGPLLALFAFGIFTKRKLREGFPVLFVCILAPALCYYLSTHIAEWFNGFQIGIELLLINAAITFIGLWLISAPAEKLSKKYGTY